MSLMIQKMVILICILIWKNMQKFWHVAVALRL